MTLRSSATRIVPRLRASATGQGLSMTEASGTRMWRRTGSIVVLLAALGFMTLVLYDLLAVEPVKVVSSELVRDGASVSVAGQLRNTGPGRGKLDVEIRYYDARGRTLGRDTVAVELPPRGETVDFSSPPRVLDGVTASSIYLNHGPNPYGN